MYVRLECCQILFIRSFDNHAQEIDQWLFIDVIANDLCRTALLNFRYLKKYFLMSFDDRRRKFIPQVMLIGALKRISIAIVSVLGERITCCRCSDEAAELPGCQS